MRSAQRGGGEIRETMDTTCSCIEVRGRRHLDRACQCGAEPSHGTLTGSIWAAETMRKSETLTRNELLLGSKGWQTLEVYVEVRWFTSRINWKYRSTTGSGRSNALDRFDTKIQTSKRQCLCDLGSSAYQSD